MKKIISTALIVWSTHSPCAEKIDAYSAKLDPLQTAAIIKSRPTSKTFIDLYFRQNPDNKIKISLMDEFEKAQKLFLTSDLSNLESLWANVLSYSTKADWRPSQRLLISTAYMRLAQACSNADKTKTAILDALQFDSDYKPDSSLFPPPIIDMYKKAKLGLDQKEISTQKFYGFDLLLVNGKQIPIDKEKLTITAGVHRFTWLSVTFKPVTKILNTTELDDLELERVPFLTGTCEQPEFHASALIPVDQNNVMAHFVENCQSPIIKGNPSAETNLSHLLPSANYSNDRSGESPNQIFKASQKAFFEKPKFWIGTALIAAAVLVIKRNGEKDSAAGPTQKEGF